MTEVRFKSTNYEIESQKLSQELLSSRFVVHRDRQQQQVNIFSAGWVFAHFESSEKSSVEIRRPDGYLKLEAGLWGFFAPSFSILDWKIGPEDFTIFTLTSRAFLPSEKSMDFRPQFFLLDKELFRQPKSLSEVEAMLLGVNRKIYAAKIDRPTSQANKIKKYIDHHFHTTQNFSQIACDLATSRETLTREFKNNFGLPPGRYRNGLRSDDALRQIALEESGVTQAAFESGYNDLSRYNRQFRENYGATPSQFKGRGEPCCADPANKNSQKL